jgi:hypothetical protein
VLSRVELLDHGIGVVLVHVELQSVSAPELLDATTRFVADLASEIVALAAAEAIAVMDAKCLRVALAAHQVGDPVFATSRRRHWYFL